MSFTTLNFLIFLPIVFIIFHFSRGKVGWFGLLLASYCFYAGAGSLYLLAVLAGVTLFSFAFGRLLGVISDPRMKRAVLVAGIGGNILVLLGMKYLPFLAESSNSIISLFHYKAAIPVPQVLVSVGISFFVFQAIGYLVDIYLDVVEVERHVGIFALTLAFFPKLLQGPIERCEDLAGQFRRPYFFDFESARLGIILFFWGVFKKVVIADRLALFVDSVYSNPQLFGGLSLATASVFYSFQIYFDFSGYTDMAIGIARLFNVRLAENFNRPYLASSVSDFWRRWHMTFSRWILNYIFKPLQMRWRYWGNWGTSVALIITFFISGIWHGASWGFIVWGIIHGMYMACSVYWKPYQKKIYRWLGVEKSFWLNSWQTAITFMLITFAWIFFRADSLTNGWYIVSHFLSSPRQHSVSLLEFIQNNLLMGQSIWDFYLILVLFTCMGAVSWFCCRTGKQDLPELIVTFSYPYRWGFYYALAFGIVFGGMFDNGTFIYFQF